MPKAIKWLLAIIAGLMAIILVAILLAPMVINIERYKPRIEAEASKALGRPVTVGGDIEPSVFPWIGVAVNDLKLGNPPGFEGDDFVSVGLFEIRMRLWPLLFGEYEVKRFVVNAPRIVLIKDKAGRTNWEQLGPAPETPPAPDEEKKANGPSIKGLTVGQFAVTDGSVAYIDLAAGTRHEIEAIQLELTDVSLDGPIGVDVSATADGHPVRLGGTIGPLGSEPGKDPLTVDLTAELLKQIDIRIQGRIEPPMDSPQAGLTIEVAPFSLRAVMDELNRPMPVETADEDAFSKIAINADLSGTPEQVAAKGVLTLDQTRLTYDLLVKEFDKPNVRLEAALDRIDLDRYLPPPSEESASAPAEKAEPAPAGQTDYGPLRKLILDARLEANELKVKNARTRNVSLGAHAENGIIRIDPFNADLYEGRVSVTGTIDVRQEAPRSQLGISLASVQAGPLLEDVAEKKVLEGVLNADMTMRSIGDEPERILKNLNGQGELNFNEGAIVGIDLANMVRNVQTAFGLAEKPAEKPRTDFSELAVPFTITDGVAGIDNARLQSPLLRVTAGGRADLVQETLSVRVEPKFVATLKGQGDIEERAGIMVPVIVSGTFEDPKFRPDLKAIIKQDLPDEKALKEMVPGEEDIKKGLEQKAGDLFKKLAPGKK